MENINEYTKHSRSFESLMTSKGYRDRFELAIENTLRFQHNGTLKQCLDTFLTELEKTGISVSDFSLKTFAEYLSTDNFKECHFSGTFDTANGFSIERLLIHSKYPDETQRLSFRNNHEVPGKHAVIGRFRKPKPWDRMMRGDFKHRKKW